MAKRRRRAHVRLSSKHFQRLQEQVLQGWRSLAEGCRYRAVFAAVAANGLHDTCTMLVGLYFGGWRSIALHEGRKRDHAAHQALLDNRVVAGTGTGLVQEEPKERSRSATELAELQSKLDANESELRQRRAEVDDLSRTLDGIRKDQTLGEMQENAPPSASETMTLDFSLEVEPHSESSRVPSSMEISAHTADKRGDLGLELSNLDEVAISSFEHKKSGPRCFPSAIV